MQSRNMKLPLAERAKKAALEAVSLGEHGVNQYSGNDKKENVMSTQGNSATYRAAKLKRDYPDVATRLESGEFKSVAETERAASVTPALPEWKSLTGDFCKSLILKWAVRDSNPGPMD
jgi:hypothetical protein